VRVNRPDTLLTELREIRRRLRLLEAGRMAPAGPAAGAGPPVPVPLLPDRPLDWPATTSPAWERLAGTRAALTRPARLTLQVHLEPGDPGTTAEVRVLLDGARVGDDLLVTAAAAHEVALPATAATAEVAVEARLVRGPGPLRVSAVLHP
jgi:hypothetical protein